MPAQAPAIVVMYHRVGRHQPDPHGLSVSPRNLAGHLAALRSRVDIVALEDLLEPSQTPRAAITFDDGHAGLADDAATVLCEADAPATFFVVAGWVGTGHTPWQDRLATMVLDDAASRPALVTVGARPVRVRLDEPARRRDTYWHLHSLLRRRSPHEIEAVLSRLGAAIGRAPARLDEFRSLDARELRALAGHPAFAIGAHSMTHPMLRRLTTAERAREVGGSREALERLLGMPVTSFAYPFGSTASFGRADVRAVRRAGFRLACTTQQARVPQQPDPFRIPRFYVGDWDAAEFAAHLDTWLSP